MYDKFWDLSQYNFELQEVKMSTTIVSSVLVVLGYLVGLGNPVWLGEGPRGIPLDFTLEKVQERKESPAESAPWCQPQSRKTCSSAATT